MMAAMICTGILATVVGAVEGFAILDTVAPDQRMTVVTPIISNAINTTALSMLFAIPLFPAIGVASFLAKRS